MKFGFYLPAAGKILLTALRRSPYDGIGLFLPLLLPHRDKASAWFENHWGGPPQPAAIRRAGHVDIQSFCGIKGTEIIRNGAAGRAPAERFRAGLKVSAAGQRPVFPRRREAETKNTDSVSERTGGGKSSRFPADM